MNGVFWMAPNSKKNYRLFVKVIVINMSTDQSKLTDFLKGSKAKLPEVRV